MSRVLVGLVAAFLCFASFADAQQLNTVVQRSPQNSRVTAAGSDTAVITIVGVAGQRVRLYAVDIFCGGATATIIPAIQITDESVLVLDKPGVTVSNENHPAGTYRWFPGYTFSPGGTVVITGNPGNVCTGGTFLTIQADQF